jgi:hypothetical protein
MQTNATVIPGRDRHIGFFADGNAVEGSNAAQNPAPQRLHRTGELSERVTRLSPLSHAPAFPAFCAGNARRIASSSKPSTATTLVGIKFRRYGPTAGEVKMA